ncbi:DUF4369 domain-containing protein [Lutibacter sp.]
MKRFFLLVIFSLILVSCKKKDSQEKQQNISIPTDIKRFELKGILENFYPKKVFLNKIIENSIYPIDSSKVINNTFTFKGIVEFPERFALTFQDYSSVVIFILENTNFELIINTDQINDPIIKGSKLNKELTEYKTKSKQIFKKIDYLFPQFQKARLENDAKELSEIGNELKSIEKEYINFSFNYILQNKNSYIAAMILRDQLKSTTIDTLKIKKTYQALSSDVKKSPDAQTIATFLTLH